MYKPVPDKVDFPSMEHGILRFWEEQRTFDKLREQIRGNERYSFFDGPITSNNPMGVHHAWGRTYKDLFQRYHAMLGQDQRFQNGFDCQGLWVEVEVEKALRLNSKREIEQYGLDRFSEACRARVNEYAQIITDQSIRLGQWMDWPNSYFTMSDNNIEHIWHFLKLCQQRGWLYKGWRTMPWCARCGTSLSQHELIGTDSYREVTHPSVYLKLPVVDRPGERFMVWTTTPWTLSANVALAVHPELDYARVRVGDETLILSTQTLGMLTTAYHVIDTVKGSELVGLRYQGPFDELPAQREVVHRVVPWEAVGEDEGTGIVHIAPGCGAEDFALSQQHDLPVLVPIDESGEYTPDYGFLYGKDVRNVAPTVFESLQAKSYLYKVEEITHRYPTCWRCGEEIVFRGVSEWFIAADEIRPRMIAAARTVEWTPPSAEARMVDWLNNMGDWCISRKRYWGLPLPFYTCQDCGELTVVGSMDELRELAISGLEEVKELHRPWIDAVRIHCPQCGTTVERIPEVGDCWLDAGIVPFSTPGGGYLKHPEEWAKWYPADWVSEMREQIRLWFYSMLFMSVALEDRAPYKAVLSYEKLMDESGRPMHKSLGNAIWFDEAAEKAGADVMRWLYAGQSLQSNLLFGYGTLEEVRRKLLTLWNSYRFYITYAESEEFEPQAVRETPQRNRLDRWILSELHLLVSEARARLDGYDPAGYSTAVDRFVDELSNWYIRRSRRRFTSPDAADRAAAFATLHECLLTLCQVIAPAMPFLAEEMYQNIERSVNPQAPESVHLTPYPVADFSLIDEKLGEEMELARAVVRLGNRARKEAGIRTRQPLPAITLAGESAHLALSEELRRDVADELNVKAVEIAENVEAFARRIARPNPKILGPKLGRDFPKVNQALQAGQYSIEPDGSVRVDGRTLTPDEVSISLQPLEHQALAQDLHWHGGLAIALDDRVTPELRDEGLMRELVHRVQTMRRDAGLSVDDRIAVTYHASDELERIIDTYRGRIREDVGATEVVASSAPPGGFDWDGQLEGESMSLSLRRT